MRSFTRRAVLTTGLGFFVACRGATPRRDAGADRASMQTLDPRHPAARRVVSLVPSATEVLFALGAGDRVVGVSTFDDWPLEATRLPRVGGMLNPSFEAIVALHPDAVVGVQGPMNMAVLERLERMGVRVFMPRVESVAEVLGSLDSFGALVGERERAHRLRTSIDAALTRVRNEVAQRSRVRVLAVFGERPLSVAGVGSWVDEVLTLAGGDNVVREGGRYPTLSLERLIALAPEVILDMTWSEDGTAPLATSLASLRSVPAVRNGRVLRANDTLLLRPGPRIGEAATRIAQMLHP